MKFYGEDCPPPRAQRVEDLYAQEILLRSAIMEEFRATFNIACALADALYSEAPNHPFIDFARAEGMLGTFELKEKDEIHKPVESSSVQGLFESGLLSLSVSERDADAGAGTVLSSEAPEPRDLFSQSGGSPDAQADGYGCSASCACRSGEIPLVGGCREELAPSGVPSLGEGGE